MPTHRAVHVTSAGAPLELVDVDTAPRRTPAGSASPSTRAVCAAPTTPSSTAAFPNLTWPLTPGHEIAGTDRRARVTVSRDSRSATGWRSAGSAATATAACRVARASSCSASTDAGAQLALPRRVRRVGDGTGHRAGADSRRAVVRRGRPDGLRGRDDVQRAAPHQGRRRRPGRGPRGSAGWATSACSGRGRWASRPSRSPAGPARPRTPRNWAPTTTSTRPPVTSPRRCRRSAVPRWCWPPRPTPRPWPPPSAGWRRRVNWSSSV